MRAVTVSLPGLSIHSPTGASSLTQTPGNLLLSYLQSCNTSLKQGSRSRRERFSSKYGSFGERWEESAICHSSQKLLAKPEPQRSADKRILPTSENEL